MYRLAVGIGMLVLTHSLLAKSRAHRYTLDPTRAEEILAQISLNPPRSTEEWEQVLGKKKSRTYTVKRGDTLWSIARNQFREPRYWPKLWQVNESLTNPHEIEIGQELSFYREGAEDEVIQIPFVKLRPHGRGIASDLDEDSVVENLVNSRARPGMMILQESEYLGEISGAYVPREGLTGVDEIYVQLGLPEPPKVGDVFTLVRDEGPFKKVANSGNVLEGRRAVVVGDIRVTGVSETLARVEIVEGSAVISRGDKVIAHIPEFSTRDAVSAPEGLSTSVLYGQEEDIHRFTQGQLVLLDLGTDNQMKTGYLFRVSQDTDPLLETTPGVLPSFKGEVQVVMVRNNYSVGLIVRCTEPIEVSDALLPKAAFMDPLPTVRKESQVLDINP